MENQSLQPPDQKGNTSRPKRLILLGIVCLLIAGFITSFVSGYFVHGFLGSDLTRGIPIESGNITPSAAPAEIIAEQQVTTQFLSGKQYFENTVILVGKSFPHKTFIATVTRNEQDKGYTQVTRVSFFDGEKWVRKSSQAATNDMAIVSNNLLREWKTVIDPSRVLKESTEGLFKVGDATIKFSTGSLQNEIAMRSLPGYTKFFSESTDGILAINDTPFPAYVLFSNIYSLNTSDIQFYNQPFGVTTDWIAFWTDDGSFYHVDKTFVEKPSVTYASHQIGVGEQPDKSVMKTFSVSVDRDAANPPLDYSIQFGTPIDTSLRFKRLNQLSKAPSAAFDWYMGQVEGEVIDQSGNSHKGIGLVEYIHH